MFIIQSDSHCRPPECRLCTHPQGKKKSKWGGSYGSCWWRQRQNCHLGRWYGWHMWNNMPCSWKVSLVLNCFFLFSHKLADGCDGYEQFCSAFWPSQCCVLLFYIFEMIRCYDRPLIKSLSAKDNVFLMKEEKTRSEEF